MAAPQTVTMYDPATGAPVVVAANQAGELFRSGKATFAADQDVPIQGADGRIEVLKGSEAGAFFQSRESYLSSGVASQQALQQQRLEDEFGGVGGTLGAVAAGAARGATLGLSDVALAETGLVDRRTLAGLQDANPLASGGGEALGILGATLATGGSAGAARGAVGTAARVASAPTRAVMALGRGVEGVGAALLGEATAARIATTAVQGAVEGSLFGVGQAVSESTIRDVPLTAERIVAAAGHGALLGGGLGAGMTATGALIRGGASKLGDVGASLLGRVEGRAAELAGELGATLPKSEGTVMALVDRYGREQAIKATGANLGMVERLQAMGRDIEDRVITKLLDAAPEALGKKPGSILNAAEKAAAAERLVQRDGERIGQMLDELAASGQKPNVTNLVGEFRQRVASETAAAVSPDAQRAARQMEDWLTSVEQKIGAEGANVKTLWEARRELRKDIDWKKPVDAGDRYNNWKRDLYRSMGDEIEATGQRAGAEGALGPDFAARWRNGNADYRASLWLEEATAKGAASDSKNRLLGLSEQLGILGGLAQGGLAGLPLAVGGALVQNLVRRYGSDVAANVARAATRGEAVHALDQAMERLMGERARSLVGGAVRVAKQLPEAAPGLAQVVEKAVRADQGSAPPPPMKMAARYQEISKDLSSQIAQREARLPELRAELDAVAPGLGEAVAGRVVATQDFLASKLPRVPERPSLQKHLERKRLPSDSEMAKFLRYERAASDPLSVFDDAHKGRLRPEGPETLRTLFPTMYQALSAEVLADVASKGDRLSYDQRVALAMLFPELPVDPSMSPKSIRAYQQIQHQAPSPFASPGGQQGAPPSPSPVPLRPPQLAPRGDQIGA